MKEYRVTKYDPSLRDQSGTFMGDEWTSFSQISESFGDSILTELEYKRVEDAYIHVALLFLDEAGITSIKPVGLENASGQPLPFHESAALPVKQLPDVMRQLLREQFWCRLEAENGFVHFGSDYYMYIGVPHRCIVAERKAIELGLYVEEFVSPYHK